MNGSELPSDLKSCGSEGCSLRNHPQHSSVLQHTMDHSERRSDFFPQHTERRNTQLCEGGGWAPLSSGRGPGWQQKVVSSCFSWSLGFLGPASCSFGSLCGRKGLWPHIFPCCTIQGDWPAASCGTEIKWVCQTDPCRKMLLSCYFILIFNVCKSSIRKKEQLKCFPEKTRDRIEKAREKDAKINKPARQQACHLTRRPLTGISLPEPCSPAGCRHSPAAGCCHNNSPESLLALLQMSISRLGNAR